MLKYSLCVYFYFIFLSTGSCRLSKSMSFGWLVWKAGKVYRILNVLYSSIKSQDFCKTFEIMKLGTEYFVVNFWWIFLLLNKSERRQKIKFWYFNTVKFKTKVTLEFVWFFCLKCPMWEKRMHFFSDNIQKICVLNWVYMKYVTKNPSLHLALSIFLERIYCFCAVSSRKHFFIAFLFHKIFCSLTK